MNNENELVLKNLPLVRSIVKKFKPLNIDQYKEYEQAGLIGLMKAIRVFNPTKGALSTIAFYHIRGEIIKYINLEKRQKLPSLPDDLCTIAKVNVSEHLPQLSEVEAKIIDLRLQGHSFKEIGILLGNYSRGWANNIYRNIIKRARNEQETCTSCK